MCGIAGLFDTAAGAPDEALKAAAAAMIGTLAHRGPDGEGSWTDARSGVALAHRRLAIIDLSPGGAQPMKSGDGRYVITYNGEIYNYRELRAELESLGRKFRSQSDTEVMLEAFCQWGVEAGVKRLIGMFALALWDARERTLYLVRDRLGVKPLYWARFGAVLLFGSELKALRAHPAWRAGVDRAALADYLRFAYVPGPATIFDGVNKLQPGHILAVRAGSEPRMSAYWSALDVARAGVAARREIADAETVDRLDALLRDAVGRRMIADVPLGAFLSGGVDSSAVVALMQAQSARPVKSFTIGFEERDYDEATNARAVAKHLGTDHTELKVTPAEAQAAIPTLAEWYDEPFADSSQIPTLLVSRLTRRHVTVSLSGDGGDEAFAGYNRHIAAPSMWTRIAAMPMPLRKALACAVAFLPPRLWRNTLRLVMGDRAPRHAGEQAHKAAALLDADNPAEMYRRLVTQWRDVSSLLDGAPASRSPAFDDGAAPFDSMLDRMRALDTATYLPDDILAKLDRASMAVALEGRVPLIDHRVIEFAWTLPNRMLVRQGQGKWILRQVLDRYVPRALVERPKTGFSLPIGGWLRGPLRGWAEDLLSERALAAGPINPAPVRKLWAEHHSGTRNAQHALWVILMYQLWAKRWAV
ncbi:MAG: asparagine synthase (glutamine-hydrolyzing) [Rhodospirillales bacterium]